MEEITFKLGELPIHILEHVLNFLPGNYLASLSSTNRTFLDLVNKILRQKFFRLVHSIFNSLQKLGQEISQLPTDTDLLLHAKWLRSYFMMELLHSEISMIKPLCRDSLYGSKQHQLYTIGPLLNEIEMLLNEAKQRNLPPWNINDERTVRILRCTKLFIDYKMQQVDSSKRCGSFILDILSLMMHKRYKITVQYYPVEGTCSIHVAYVYDNPQFLNRPPRVTDETNALLSAEDKKNMMTYVMGLVRINNRLTLREEQYYRELEYTARSDETFLAVLESLELSAPNTWLLKSVRHYETIMPNPTREIIWNDGTYIVQEVYSSPEFTFETIRGFRLNSTMRCCLHSMPLGFIACWSRLKCDVRSDITKFVTDTMDWMRFNIFLKEKENTSDDESLNKQYISENGSTSEESVTDDICNEDRAYFFECNMQIIHNSAGNNDEEILKFFEI